MRKVKWLLTIFIFALVFLGLSAKQTKACVNWCDPECVLTNVDGSCRLYATSCCDGGGPLTGQLCDANEYACNRAGGCCPLGTSGGSGQTGPGCIDRSVDCAPGSTISLNQPVFVDCHMQFGGQYCSGPGTAQRVTGCCDNLSGGVCVSNPEYTTYNCCPAGTTDTRHVGSNYTAINSCWTPTRCSGDDQYVSYTQPASAGLCYVGCSEYNQQGNCKVGKSYNVYNAATVCKTITYSCDVTCNATAPSAGSVVQGSSISTAIVNWTIGSNGTSQRLYVDQSQTEVNNGCTTPNACEVSATLFASDNSYLVSSLLPSTTYYFRVVTYKDSACTRDVLYTYTTPANNALSGVVYLDNNNNCTGTAWNAGSLGALTVTARGTAYSGSVGNDGRFSFATGTTSSIPYLDLSTPPTGYTCPTGVGCNNNCSLSNLTSPSSTNYFYLSQSREAWWQAVGGSIYSAGNVRSEIPSASLSLIAPGAGGALGALMRSSGTVDTGVGAVSSEGYSAQTTYKGKTMNYDFFAAHMGVTNNTQNYWGADTMNKPASIPARDFYYINPSGSEASVTTPWNVASGESYVVFVNGDLRIASDVVVAPGGFLAFIVNGSVNVSPAVASVQGLYVIDSTFASETNAATDVALEVEGSVVAWGGVSLGRDLVNTNSSTPAESFTYRPDLLTNMPEKMKVFALKWEEVVPGTFE